MIRVRGPRGGAAAAACLLALLAACTVGPSERPPVAVRGENLPQPPATAPATPTPDALPPLTPQSPSIPFVDCTAVAFAALQVTPPTDRTLRVECSQLPVPTDPLEPTLGSTLVGVVRVGAGDGPLDRPPLLALGDSTGSPSIRQALALAATAPAALLDTFAVVGMDRRGFGTDRLDCASSSARAALVDADPGATSPAELDALLEVARGVVQDCNLATPSGVTSFRSSASAADVEALRVSLGVAQLAAIGVGDGAGVLLEWARAAPGGVGRLVLDGPPDPAVDEPDRTVARAEAADAAFDAFALSCSAPGACALGPDPRATTTALVEGLRAQPLVTADGRRLTAGGAVTAVLATLGEPGSWPALSAGIAAAAAGDAAPLLALLEPVTGPDGTYDGRLATSCNDHRRRLTPTEVGDLAGRLRTDRPLFGGALALQLLACAAWPTGGPGGAEGQGGGLPPVLVIGTAGSPRAADDESRRVADALPSGRYLSWQGSGLGAYPRTGCVTDVVDALLVDGRAPESGTLCPP